MSGETEAKFIVPDRRACQRIQEIDLLGGFALSGARVVEARDTYLDTAGRAILSGGYALRRREQEGTLLITLKSTTPATGAIHKREEWETVLSSDVEPAMWPEGEARSRVLALIGNGKLGVLFRLRQQRFLREAHDGGRHVATVSLDEVHVEIPGRRQDYWELEIELAPEGREDELDLMAGWMRSHYDLLPSTRSKFERALELATRSPAAPRYAARAGVPDESVIMEAPDGMSEDDLLARLASMGFRARPPGKRSDRMLFRDTHDGALLRAGYGLCFSHATSTWRLLKGTRLEAEERGIADAPASGGHVGASVSAITHARPTVEHLDASLEESEYRLAGLAERQIRLRVQRWQLVSPFQEVAPRSVTSLCASGDPSATGIGYFSSLLRDRLGCRLLEGAFLAWGLSRLGVAVPGASPPAELSLSPQDAMQDACRKILRVEAWRMRACVQGARHDIDPEYVHDFRVATRRARFALKLFAGVLPDGRATDLRMELSWIAGLLGAVRDIDVLMARLEDQFLQMDAGPDFQAAIRGRLGDSRGRAREEMAAALQSERCSILLNALESTPEGNIAHGLAEGLSPRSFARRRIDKAFVQLQRWLTRPAEDLEDTELHGLRILFKRLRYTCDFFRPILGPRVGELVKSFVAYQDCLGMHQDAAVALGTLKALARGRPSDPEDFALSLGALMQVQRNVLKEQRTRFLGLWETADALVARWKGRDGGEVHA